MSDLISRQAAIDALSHMMDIDGFCDGWAVSRANVDSMLKSIPPAQPERKKGKWEVFVVFPFDGEDVKCSECKTSGCAPYWNFCPHCGADMRIDAE